MILLKWWNSGGQCLQLSVYCPLLCLNQTSVRLLCYLQVADYGAHPLTSFSLNGVEHTPFPAFSKDTLTTVRCVSHRTPQVITMWLSKFSRKISVNFCLSLLVQLCLLKAFIHLIWDQDIFLKLEHASCDRQPELQEITGRGRSPGEGNGNPLQCSCLRNPMDSRGWWATVHGVSRVRPDWVSNQPINLRTKAILLDAVSPNLSLDLFLTGQSKSEFYLIQHKNTIFVSTPSLDLLADAIALLSNFLSEHFLDFNISLSSSSSVFCIVYFSSKRTKYSFSLKEKLIHFFKKLILSGRFVFLQ